MKDYYKIRPDTHKFNIFVTERGVLHNNENPIYVFLGFAWPQSQFSCVCEQFIHSKVRPTYFLQQNRQIDHGNI
jgi:hypothetical protein